MASISPSQTVPTPRPSITLLAALAAGFFLLAVFVHFGGLAELVTRWNRQEEYGHGFFIPLLSAWMLWTRRDAIVGTLGDGRLFAGFGLLALTLVMLVVGELSALFLLVQLSFIFCLASFALIVGGWRLLRLCAFPLAYLLFAIPLPYFIDSTLSWRLQLLSSDWGVAFLRLFGVPVYLQGNVIDLGLYQLQVVEACSGLRYLYPLMSLSILAAYLFKAPLWQRVLVFLSAIPITILMNSFRIGMIGILVNQFGTGMAEGALHFFEGWVIFMACAVILFLEIWLLARLNGHKDVFSRLAFPALGDVKNGVAAAAKAVKPAGAAIAAFLIVLTALQLLDARTEIVPERAQLSRFPLSIGSWSARERSLGVAVENALQVDDYVIADYSHPEFGVSNLYVAYYASQRKGVSPHSPRVCIPGGGWEITKFDRSQVVRATGQALPVNRLIIEKGADKLLVYYWFDQRGKTFANEYLMKAHLLKDAIVMNRTDGALVRVTTPLFHGENIGAAEQRLQTFLKTVEPKLDAYIPGSGPA